MTDPSPAAVTVELVDQLRAAFKSRALFYHAVFDEMRRDFGEDKAKEIMKRAIRRRGEAISGIFAPHAPRDLPGLRDTFLAFIPQGAALFAPEVVRCDEGELTIQFHRCPLKEAWEEAGLSESERSTMCELAGVVDAGTFESAGFAFAADTWKPGRGGCCRLHIRPGSAG
jgi:hypothetical protein